MCVLFFSVFELHRGWHFTIFLDLAFKYVDDSIQKEKISLLLCKKTYLYFDNIKPCTTKHVGDHKILIRKTSNSIRLIWCIGLLSILFWITVVTRQNKTDKGKNNSKVHKWHATYGMISEGETMFIFDRTHKFYKRCNITYLIKKVPFKTIFYYTLSNPPLT